MNFRNREPSNTPEAPPDLEELCAVVYAIEMHRWEKGASEFVYDAKLDIFCFPEDGRFAFCEEFADWTRLEERGYLHF
jgi:hypothetical protein